MSKYSSVCCKARAEVLTKPFIRKCDDIGTGLEDILLSSIFMRDSSRGYAWVICTKCNHVFLWNKNEENG